MEAYSLPDKSHEGRRYKHLICLCITLQQSKVGFRHARQILSYLQTCFYKLKQVGTETWCIFVLKYRVTSVSALTWGRTSPVPQCTIYWILSGNT
jgi:hypothetical protein